MMRGVRPTPDQLALLAPHSSRRLALESDGLARETAASAKRGEPVTRVNLRALLEAAARLAARAATTPSPPHAAHVAARSTITHSQAAAR